jgi:SAM-dependent methyltransferase
MLFSQCQRLSPVKPSLGNQPLFSCCVLSNRFLSIYPSLHILLALNIKEYLYKYMNSTTNTLLSQFKTLADPVRTRIVALCRIVECSISELTQVIGQSQPRISQHVKQLCEVNFLERFKDGHFVYYRVRTDGEAASTRRRLLALLPIDEPQFSKDIEKLQSLRVYDDLVLLPTSDADRSLHRALVELTVSRPLGDLLDIGCGTCRVLKLLASRANRCVGVDIDPNARRLARAALLLAGTPDTTLRQGDMASLAFADGEFDTVILDDVLGSAKNPVAVVAEALRVLDSDGRLLILSSVLDGGFDEQKKQIAAWAVTSDLRLALPRSIPNKNPSWLLAVAMLADNNFAPA